ncbi:Glutathione-regulated potassium-efflux system protein KefB [Porphyromonas levii]|uniref:cation:proton antiporter n=1 Tax=Porphyromonas levii TaxID=28114 RepID=UPI001BAC392F|nr:cation:proton antiporter [Porphyromonas levii]MBR8772979.1 Glutathione-regulated potassium-efflux system protein KefB [Porphyromonas levii]
MSKWRNNRDLIYYGLMLIVGVVAVILLTLVPDPSAVPTGGNGTLGEAFGIFLDLFKGHIISPFGLLLLQVIVILIFARIVAWLFTKLGQPSVIGEILAGIVLGPSVMGWLWPEGFQFLFPSASLHNISLLSQFGLIFFMFVIGMELDLDEIRKQLRKSFVIAHSGIVAPFILGVMASIILYDTYGGEKSSLLTFALFVGISLSVTAFPVLARIIQEQGKMKDPIGVLSMASAANGDITAWCLLAVIMAIAQAGSPLSALFTVLFAAVYMLLMFLIVRPAFAVIGSAYNTKEVAGKGIVALAFVVLLISSYVTEILGLHALFGAFIAGVVMPTNLNFRHMLTEKVEDVSLAVFLPLFFVSSGLSTQIGLLNTPAHWWVTLAITLVAILGKVGGTYGACRVVGETRRDSLYMGVLMNTRGLMELVILSMGLQLEILSPVMYAILVIMTLVTTFMTTPILHLVNKLWPAKIVKAVKDGFHILFSFGRSRTGITMMRIVESFFPKLQQKINLVGLHLTIGSDTSWGDAEHYRAQSFAPIQSHADNQGYDVEEYYEVTDNPIQSIVKATKVTQTDLLLVGASLELSTNPEDKDIRAKRERFVNRFGRTLASATELFNVHNLFKDKTNDFVSITNCAVGVVIDRGLAEPARSISVLSDKHKSGFKLLSGQLLADSHAEIHHYFYPDIAKGDYSFADHDLLIMPYPLWITLKSKHPDIVDKVPTTLLLQTHYSH